MIARFQNGSVHFQPGQLFLSHRDVLSRSLSIARHAFPRQVALLNAFEKFPSVNRYSRSFPFSLSLSLCLLGLSHAYTPPSPRRSRIIDRQSDSPLRADSIHASKLLRSLIHPHGFDVHVERKGEEKFVSNDSNSIHLCIETVPFVNLSAWNSFRTIDGKWKIGWTIARAVNIHTSRCVIHRNLIDRSGSGRSHSDNATMTFSRSNPIDPPVPTVI